MSRWYDYSCIKIQHCANSVDLLQKNVCEWSTSAWASFRVDINIFRRSNLSKKSSFTTLILGKFSWRKKVLHLLNNTSLSYIFLHATNETIISDAEVLDDSGEPKAPSSRLICKSWMSKTFLLQIIRLYVIFADKTSDSWFVSKSLF